MSQNHAFVKDPFKLQDRLTDFSVTNKKFNDIVSEFSVKLTLKKLLLAEFQHNIKKEYPQFSQGY